MAHKIRENAIKDVKEQQTFRGLIGVWRKDYERWQDDLIAAIDLKRYNLIAPPRKWTKNQYFIAERKEDL